MAALPARLPRIERLVLGRVTRVPPWHPEHDAFEPFPVHAWVVRHPDGPVLVDAGIGGGHAAIDEWYGPEVVPLAHALAGVGLGVDDVAAVVLSHLHFDHCGQHDVVGAPVHVQAEEVALAASAGAAYTVPEWAEVEEARLRLVHGDEGLMEGVRLLATPGHTPGHQSVVVEAEDGRVVLGAQCAFRAAEVQRGEPSAANLHGAEWEGAARQSLARVRSLRPVAVELSHDPARIALV